MHTQIIRRVVRDTAHEILDPFLALGIARAGRADQLLPLMLAQREHLLAPDIGRVLGSDARAFRLVEEQDDGFLCVLDVLPVAAGELGFEMDHRTERGAAFELGRDPGVPVADGGDGAFEVDGVHGPGDAFVAGAVGVGPVYGEWR